MRDALATRPSLRIVGLAAAGALAVVLYPLAAERALAAWGPRGVGVALLCAGPVSLVLLHGRREVPGTHPLFGLALLAFPALAAATDDALFLRLVPAAVQAGVAGLFLLSLRGGGSLFQTVALWMHPYAPDFIRPYCRKATAVFAGVFAMQAVAVAVLALRPPGVGWALASGVLVWAPVAMGFAIEWAVRKAWFRYYGDGPVDRVLRVLLPPERTAQGRRSLEYMQTVRRQLGMSSP